MKKYAYCNKEIPENQEIKTTITFRTRDTNGNAIICKKQNEYCCVECTSYDKFAHEG